MIGRLINAVAIVVTVMSLMVVYSYWRIGSDLERDLITCVDGR
jgi:CHASE3 domain sensor protein